MNKKIKTILIVILTLVIVCLIGFFLYKKEENLEIQSIKSEKQLLKMYNDDNDSNLSNLLLYCVTMPYSFFNDGIYIPSYSFGDGYSFSRKTINSYMEASDTIGVSPSSFKTSNIGTKKDYSTTNIQVENADEADITKTDGDYIYSLSGNKVIITNVTNPEKIEIENKIYMESDCVPEDLILYKNKLIVIAEKNSSSYSKSYRYSNANTVVKIYDITSKKHTKLIKSYELNEPYYTSRCINNKLYVISCGMLRKDDNKIERKYKENNVEQEIPLNKIKYLKDVKTDIQTIISGVDLDNIEEKVKIDSYLIDISNAYVSENSIYLLDEEYNYKYYSDMPPISSIFGIKGIIGAFTYNDDYKENESGYHTKIYKFNISESKGVSYSTKTEIKGRTINQYSLDEKNGHLRIALYDGNGSRIEVFDENLKQIGTSNNVAKGETMYSSRFIGDKVYFVTYKTMDPLFVMDLSDETNIKVLGELHIPGYSTYLHPYDENHLIGIGMETEEIVYKDSNGKVYSKSDRIIGMKMALFDVTDLKNPIQISQTVIGDRKTTSAILTNPKALLFSKEKQLIAIPVNNYKDNFEINTSSNSYSELINQYTNYSKAYNAEGYFVYNINVKDGFKLKGIITHETEDNNKTSYYRYNSKLLRGMYIDNNLYTVSENAVKVNSLDNLKLISEIKIK